MKRAIFVGRWSPFHKGHLAMMQKKIDEGVPLLILVRDTHYDIYPAMLRRRMIEAAMQKLKVDAKVMIIDDIDSVNYGRDVGYEVNEIKVSDADKSISATNIRNLIENKDDAWKTLIPDGAAKVLDDYLSDHGLVLWFTGLHKAGKSTISQMVSKALEDRGIRNEIVDGGVLRKSISKDLTFSKHDRLTNMERAVFISKLITRNGGVVLSSFITPYENLRTKIRKDIEENATFVEIYVKASIETCKKRDDGMYAKAEKGEIEDFTGVSDRFDEPVNPDLVLDTEQTTPEECTRKVLAYIDQIK